ncbi:MAG: putative flavoprotein (TIGR03862 family) [Saprospiraceae bacterium]|jgi:uncharacterized flavoprotein (TIGR03862 family)
MKKSVSIIGGGTASLFLAAFLDAEKFEVTIYEANSSLGRKFLVAGDGGFNLTHSEPVDEIIKRYAPADFLTAALKGFSNEDLIAWLSNIGIKTFVGSSGRIFPVKGIKPIAVLDAITKDLKSKNVQFKFKHRFNGWNKENDLVFNEEEVVKSDLNIFALGGGSWKVTGSDGLWLKTFSKKGVATVPLCASNCAYDIEWPEKFVQKNEGEALKNITISCDGSTQKGEVVITEFGIEGNAIYGLGPQIQKQLSNGRSAKIEIDLKKQFDESVVLNKLSNSELNTTVLLKNTLKLGAVQIDMLKMLLTKEEFIDHKVLAHKIKNFPLLIKAAGPLDEAISTTGGVSSKSLNSMFELVDFPGNYCIGEMVDWNAPTGGYLIQACASMGVFVARILNGVK